ncbi:MAG TPA: AarF/UbiB family protein [Bacillota bacterium]|nr:AarF/UbiB family protein [Bacillota bacterium]
MEGLTDVRLKLFRRFLIIRLVLSFVLDYWKIGRLKKRLQGEQLKKAVNQVHTNAGIRMRLTAFRLKGVIVKIGQFLSMRQDLLPEAFTKELMDLVDALPAAPFSQIEVLIQKELKQKAHKLFKQFDEQAIAAASLAQVHRATLMDGSVVAVKIIRPGMERLAKADLDSLGLAAKLVRRIPSIHRRLDFVQMHREFTETIQRELDCRQELLHLQRFTEMFAHHSRIKIPKVYEPYTTRRILVMEYIEGIRITDQQKLRECGIDEVSTAKTLLESYLRQLLVSGFVHVDPHPGNLFVLLDGRLCFLDFGMMDELSTREVQTFRRLVQSILLNDPNGVLHALKQLGFLPPSYSAAELKPLLDQVVSKLFGKEHTGAEMNSLLSIFHNSPIQLQAKYMFIMRGIGFLITTLGILAPHTNWLEWLFDMGLSMFNTSIQTNEDNV